MKSLKRRRRALNEDQMRQWEDLKTETEAQAYRELRLHKIGHFFGDDFFVATGRKSGQSGVAILEGATVHWFPSIASSRPPGPSETYWLFIGRRILQAFHR